MQMKEEGTLHKVVVVVVLHHFAVISWYPARVSVNTAAFRATFTVAVPPRIVVRVGLIGRCHSHHVDEVSI